MLHHNVLDLSQWFNDNIEEPFTPLNSNKSDILCEVDHLGLIIRPARVEAVGTIAEKKEGPSCSFHWVKGHHTEDCILIKREIKALVQHDKLSTYMKEDISTTTRKRSPWHKDVVTNRMQPKKGKSSEEIYVTHMSEQTLNTIVGGFAGREETSSAQKCYERLVMNVSQNEIPEAWGSISTVVSFSKTYSKGVLANENDPMVIKVCIKDWNVNRVLIDPGSSTDMLY